MSAVKSKVKVKAVKVKVKKQVKPEQDHSGDGEASGDSFTLENAKTGRASCKKCKQKIDKDGLRIGHSYENKSSGYSMTRYVLLHVFDLID
jgi:hypothetical protein